MYPFKPGSFAPRNGWYVIAFPHEITRSLMTRWVLNEPVVLYRKEDGSAVAVAGRCPHRHFPLGDSKLIGDTIQCGYHGITFGPDGACTRVPTQTNIPSVYRIKSYPLVEKGLWMWIWAGEPELADESLIPSPDEIGLTLPGYTARAFYALHVKGRYQLLNDNLLDLSHLGFLHGTTIGTDENASAPEEREATDRWLRSRRTMRGAACPPVTAEMSGYGGLIDRLAGMDFYLPGFHSGIDETVVADPQSDRFGEMLNAARVWHAVTPSTHGETWYFFAMSSTDPKQLDFLETYLKPVVDEDVFATEAIEKIVQKIDDLPPELMLKSDTTAVQGRRMLQAMMDVEQAPV